MIQMQNQVAQSFLQDNCGHWRESRIKIKNELIHKRKEDILRALAYSKLKPW